VIELNNEGTVLSFTELYMPPEGFTSPLTMALVELEFGAVVLCLSEETTGPQVEIGSKVRLMIDTEERLRFHSF
jgi:uncharacterized OB-fold protein